MSFAASTVHATDDTIKVGILHSLSGTMAVSESVLKDTGSTTTGCSFFPRSPPFLF
jgi:hypothetical protein